MLVKDIDLQVFISVKVMFYRIFVCLSVVKIKQNIPY